MATTEAKDLIINDTDISALLKRKKKKKKKKRGEKKSEKVEKDGTASTVKKAPEKSGETKSVEGDETHSYDYADMLNHAFVMMAQRNPDFGKTKRYVMKPPMVCRIGSKRSSWMNFMEICGLLKREPNHVLSFYLAELSTEGSIDGSGRITLKGLFKTQKIESLLRKYITNYVMCAMCRSPETILKKESASRLYFVNCKACGASRTVAAVQRGFQAVKRGQRRKARAAQ